MRPIVTAGRCGRPGGVAGVEDGVRDWWWEKEREKNIKERVWVKERM